MNFSPQTQPDGFARQQAEADFEELMAVAVDAGGEVASARVGFNGELEEASGSYARIAMEEMLTPRRRGCAWPWART